MRRSIGVGAAAVMMLLALSGCGPANPAPKPFDPSAGPTVSGTVSDTRSDTGDAAPTMPEAATRDDVVGAKAFVRYYFDVVNHVMHTGDITEFDRLSAAGCVSCQGTIKVAEEIYGHGGVVKGDGMSISQVRVDPRGRIAEVRGAVTLAREKTIRSAGATPSYAAAENHQFEMELRRTDGEWKVQQWALVS